jgi:hypothetical protein
MGIAERHASFTELVESLGLFIDDLPELQRWAKSLPDMGVYGGPAAYCPDKTAFLMVAPKGL